MIRSLTARIAELPTDPADLEEIMATISKRNSAGTAGERAAYNDGLVVAAAAMRHYAAVRQRVGKPVEAEFCQSLGVLLCGQGVKP